MIKALISKIFSLPSDSDWSIVPCAEDPRGFCEVYGKTMSAQYPLDGGEFYYRDLTVFWDYFTVEVVNLCELMVTPTANGIEIQAMREGKAEKRTFPLKDFSMSDFLQRELDRKGAAL